MHFGLASLYKENSKIIINFNLLAELEAGKQCKKRFKKKILLLFMVVKY